MLNHSTIAGVSCILSLLFTTEAVGAMLLLFEWITMRNVIRLQITNITHTHTHTHTHSDRKHHF